jgi:hypothetical protein
MRYMNSSNIKPSNKNGGSKLKHIKKVIILPIVAVVMLVGVYLFCHSTPVRSIRTYLFFNGYFTKALKTEVCISNEVSWKGKYYCNNPGIGPDFIAVKKRLLGLWYVDPKNSGGA